MRAYNEQNKFGVTNELIIDYFLSKTNGASEIPQGNRNINTKRKIAKERKIKLTSKIPKLMNN